MNYKVALILAALAVSIVIVSFRASKGAPSIPRDVFHSMVISNAACKTCHTPGKQAPLKASHVTQEECMICHKVNQPR